MNRYLCPEPYLQKNIEFNLENNVNLVQCPLIGNKV